MTCSNLYSSSECEKMADEGNCESDRDWMSTYCRRSCNNCGQPGSNSYPLKKMKNISFGVTSQFLADTCKNEQPDDSCDGWALRGECDLNPKWMRLNCAHSCGFCDQQGTSKLQSTLCSSSSKTSNLWIFVYRMSQRSQTRSELLLLAFDWRVCE